MTVFGEAIIVVLAAVAVVGALAAMLYLLWLIVLDVRRNVGGRAPAPGLHVLRHAKR